MAPTIGIPVKVVRPRVASVLARERLFALLDGARERPLTWISGPGGWGKTTLVASYVEARGLPCLWFHVDEGDADLAAFFHYLGLAARAVAPRRKGRFPALTPEYLLGIPEFSRNFFSRLAEWLPRPCLLVFDNCQHVAEDAALYRAVLEGRMRLAADQSVVFLSRSQPPPALAQIQANRQLVHIGTQELQITNAEFDAIAALHGVDPTTRTAIAPLRDAMHGWAAGLVLLLAGRELLPAGGVAGAREVPEAVFDYFSEEILAGLEEEPRTFLLQTSFLPDMTAAQAEALTGQAGGGRILSWLHRHNLFLEKRVRSVPVYRYHPLFLEFLQEQARTRFSSEDVATLQRSAAGLLIQAGRHEPAVALLSALRDWEGLIGIILEQAPTLLQQGRIQTLSTWLESIPPEVRTHAPWLAYWQGVAQLPVNPPEAQAHFEQAFEQFTRQPDGSPGRALAWAGILQAIVYGFTDFHPLDAWLARMEEIVGSPEDLPAGPVGARIAAAIYLAIPYRDPARRDFAAWENRALHLIDTTEDPYCKVQVLTHAIIQHGIRGSGPIMDDLLGRVEALRQAPDAPDFVHLSELFAETHAILWGGGDPARSIDVAHRALAMSKATGIHFMDEVFHGGGVVGTLKAGDMKEAEKWLGSMQRSSASATTSGRALYHHLRGSFELVRGNLQDATRHNERSLELTGECGFVHGHMLNQLLKAAIRLASGDVDRCIEHLDAAEAVLRPAGWRYYLVESNLLRAQCCLEAGDNGAGLESLERAFGRARDLNVPALYVYVLPWLASLCARALAEDIEPDIVRLFIRQLKLVPDTPPLQVEQWPWPLRIYTLGRFEIVRDGTPLRSSGKAQQRPLALLKALIAMGGRNVSEVRLADALWPDADGDAARQSLKIALHRLRKLIGLPGAILYAEGSVSLDPRLCWVDVWALERLLNKSKPNAPGTEELAALERGLDLYGGAFLAAETSETWAIPARERLRSRFLRATETLGDRLEETGRWEEAVERYLRALEIDPRVERFYQRLMLSYQQLGRPAAALSTYGRCHEVLSKTLGIRPSPQTEAIRQDLVSRP